VKRRRSAKLAAAASWAQQPSAVSVESNSAGALACAAREAGEQQQGKRCAPGTPVVFTGGRRGPRRVVADGPRFSPARLAGSQHGLS
jgi:hypothetical protein